MLGRAAATPLLEYNLCSDAEAAQVVLRAGIPTTLIPLDVTWQVFFTAADVRRLRASSSALVETLCTAIDVWAPLQRAVFGSSVELDPTVMAFLHDPLTVATVLDPSMVQYERLRLQPSIIDGAFQLVPATDAPEFQVAVTVDAPRFREILLARLLSLR